MKVNQILAFIIVGITATILLTTTLDSAFLVFLIFPIWVICGLITFLLFPRSERRKFHGDRPWTLADTGAIAIFMVAGPFALCSITFYILAEKRAAKPQGH